MIQRGYTVECVLPLSLRCAIEEAMDNDSSHEPVYFIDGCIMRSGQLCLLAKSLSIDVDERDFSRIYFQQLTDWGKRDLSANVVSLCQIHEQRSCYALCEQGEVIRYTPEGPAIERIADAQRYGALAQIRAIGGELYACGMHGQVYRRDGENRWRHVDQGILQIDTPLAHELHLRSIDGTAADDIYVVSSDGRILHWNGHAWREQASLTHLPLERVHCASPGETYVCGNHGTFLRITPQGIEYHSIELADHFWSLTSFQGNVYVAALAGLYVFDGESLEPLDTGLTPPIGGYRLDAFEGRLWSFGVNDLACFDGRAWSRRSYPDSE